MKTIKDFTPKIQAKIPNYISNALQGVSDGGRYNNFSLEGAIKAVEWNYAKCGYKTPLVLVAENPLEMQLMFNYVKSLLKDSQLRSQLDSQLRSQLYSQLDSQLDSQLRSQLRSQLGSQLGSQLRSQLGSQLGEYNSSYLFTLNFYSDCYYAWYEFIRKEFDLDFSLNYDFQECFKLQRESGVCQAIFLEGLCVVSKYPKKVYWNENNALNNVDGVAIEWGKSIESVNFDCYYINGMNVPTDIFTKIKTNTYTISDFLKEKNEEVKSAAIAMMQEVYGDSKIVDLFADHIKEVDTFIDKKSEEKLIGTTNSMNVGVYTLFKGHVNNIEISYVRCYCPSTDRMFFLGVENTHSNAKDAIASLYRVPRKLVNHIKYIQRQGERFSTVFNEVGTEMLKKNKLSEEDIRDTVSIKGDEYFGYMEYEY